MTATNSKHNVRGENFTKYQHVTHYIFPGVKVLCENKEINIKMALIMMT
jgi:hypothetical protein